MKKKSIVSVEFQIPLEDVRNVSIGDRISLTDADLVVFSPPSLREYASDYFNPTYQGKRTINSNDSFGLRDDLDYWRTELRDAAQHGKTVIVFQAPLIEVYVDTGKREYSGTGRNQKETRVVQPIGNYSSVPVNATVRAANGQGMTRVAKADLLAIYWQEVGELSGYCVYFEDDTALPLVVTRTGNRMVGALYRTKTGALILLPALLSDAAQKFGGGATSGRGGKPSQKAFWRRLLEHLLEIDRALKASYESSPVPDWANSDAYRTRSEGELERQILGLNQKIEEMRRTNEGLRVKLRDEGLLRGLVYEKGKSLEVAILHALKLLGFSAEPFKNGESEFDAVFVSPEGRFLGEAEGKDAAPVNVDKIRQLEMNIQEDFSRDGVSEHAKGVLFGNAHRLIAPEKRGDFFTQKCRSSAIRSGIALIKTPDLFRVAKSLKDAPDEEYARRCRGAILAASGREVVFPDRGLPISDGGVASD